MNYKRNGNYYIVAKYRDFETPEIIPLRQSWYLEDGKDDFVYGNDIASIDLVTTKFSSMDGFKRLLNKEGLLKNNFADIYIVHEHKYNGKKYLSTYELLFNQKDYRTELINNIANKRLNNEEIKQKDTENFYNRFFNKINARESFKRFLTLPFKPNNEYFSLEMLKESNSLKLKYSNVTKDYITTRNIVNMWNLYDVLSRRYEDIDEVKKGHLLGNDYTNMLNIRNNRRIDENEIMKLIDKNQVPGQITMEDFLNSQKEEVKEEKPVKKTREQVIQEELEAYRKSLKDLVAEERRIREEEEFDSPKLRDLAQRINVYELVSYLNNNDLKNLTPKDRLKLGMIDIVTYHNILDAEKRKSRD